jgi:hypothetical protein
MRRQLETFMGDIDKKLERLPQPASLSEKRRIFDGKLKILETALNDAVGARGNSNLGNYYLRPAAQRSKQCASHMFVSEMF